MNSSQFLRQIGAALFVASLMHPGNGALADSRIAACFSKTRGLVNIIKNGLDPTDSLVTPELTGKCKKLRGTLIIWAKEGVIGQAGSIGIQGLKGEKGDKGDPGDSLQNEITVSASGGDFTNPREALNSITNASGTNPYVVRLGPGIYDIGANQLAMKPFVSIVGAGQDATIITGTGVNAGNPRGVLYGADNAVLRDLTVQNTGTAEFGAVAIYNVSASPHIERVRASASGRIGNYGIVNAKKDCPQNDTTPPCPNPPAASPVMIKVTANATGGASNFGIVNSNSSSAIMTQVDATASGGSVNYAVYNLTGSSPIMTLVNANASGGATNIGIYNVNSDTFPIMSRVAATASASTLSYGMKNDLNASPKIQDSSFTGSTFGVTGIIGTTRIINTQISGLVNDLHEGVQCRDVYDSDLNDIFC